MTQNNAIAIDYTDQQLRVFVEEYIIQQRGTFTVQGACSYVLYWAMEDGHTTCTGLYDGNQLCAADCQRVSNVLQMIVREGRIAADGDKYKKV